MNSPANSKRPEIPESVKRQVRQRCGFGCIFCGLPLYEYEHMLGWANVKRHIAKEITLLCDRHHRERTNGLLSKEAVEQANTNPYNRRSGISPQYKLHYSTSEFEVVIGSNHFKSRKIQEGKSVIPLMIDGVPVLYLTLKDGQFLISFRAFDAFNRCILNIHENHLAYSIAPWDIEFEGRRLTIRAEQRDILLELVFEVPNRLVIRRANILLNGVQLIVRPEIVFVANLQPEDEGIPRMMANCNLISDAVHLAVGEIQPDIGAALHWPNILRDYKDQKEVHSILRKARHRLKCLMHSGESQ